MRWLQIKYDLQNWGWTENESQPLGAAGLEIPNDYSSDWLHCGNNFVQGFC